MRSLMRLFRHVLNQILYKFLYSFLLITEYSYIGNDRSIFIITRYGLSYGFVPRLRTCHVLDSTVDNGLFKFNAINPKNVHVTKDKLIIDSLVLVNGSNKFNSVETMPYNVALNLSIKNVNTNRRFCYDNGSLEHFEEQVKRDHPELFL